MGPIHISYYFFKTLCTKNSSLLEMLIRTEYAIVLLWKFLGNQRNWFWLIRFNSAIGLKQLIIETSLMISMKAPYLLLLFFTIIKCSTNNLSGYPTKILTFESLVLVRFIINVIKVSSSCNPNCFNSSALLSSKWYFRSG